MNLPERCAVAIVGGGPAGSALAALLAREGGTPVLLEKCFFPRAKVCGEFLSMEAQGLLRRIGCLDAVLERAPAILERARIFSPSGRRVDFTLGAGALGISRFALDEILFRHARACGAAAFEGVEVLKIESVPDGQRLTGDRRLPGGTSARFELRADRVILAGGRTFAPPAEKGGPLFVGCKRRYRFLPKAGTALRGCVEIHLFDGGYCGLSEVEDEGANVCLLAEGVWFRALPSPKWDAVCSEMSRLSPSLGDRLSSLRADGEPLAVARISLGTPNPAPSPHLRIGDAAGMIAPLCGDGQSMALESAILLSELMGHASAAALPAAWAAVWRRRFSSRLVLGRVLQRLLLQPHAAEAAAAVFGRWPFLARPLLAATRSAFPAAARAAG